MNKISVLYICPNKDLCGASQSLLDMIDSLPSDKIDPVILIASEGDMAELCRNRGYRCLIKPFTDLAGLYFSLRQFLKWPWGPPIIKYFIKDLQCVWYLRQNLKKNDINLVHSNVSGCTIGTVISHIWNVPHVWHIREALDLHFNKKICLGMRRLKRLVNNADARIAISTAIKKHMEMKDDNTFVINDAIRDRNDSVFISKKDKYFLFLSYGLTEAKGALIAIEAFCRSGLYSEGYRLKMVGHCEPSMKKKIELQASQYNCNDFIDFIPCQKDVKPFFAHATAFIQASVYEGLGRTTAEAMFFGCPVIATSYSGGTLDLIEDLKTGYLFETIEQCATLMTKVAFSDQTEIIQNAQKFATDNLTLDTFGPKLLKVYNSLF